MTRKIRKLSQELKSLREKRDAFNKETEQWAEKRDTINKQIKDLRLEATNIRERRDTANEKVKDLKIQRDQKVALIREVIEETKQLKKKIRLLAKKKPIQAANAIRKEKEQIEWKIQTTSLTLQEEKPLVKKANQLEVQLNIYEKINDARKELTESQNKIKIMDEEARSSHTQLSELAQLSQELHSKMIKTIKKAKTLQTEADNYHQIFLQNKQKSHKIHIEYTEVQKEVKTLKKELAETEEKEKMLQQEETRKRLKAKVLKKLKQGKKLTLEEFKLLAGEEMT